MNFAAITATAIALAGAPAFAAPTPAADISAKTYSDRVTGLTEIQRLGVMRRAILDAGEACQRPISAAIQGPYKNMIMWNARCMPAGDYAVFIGPNALVQVRQCEQLARLKLPICTLPPRPAAAPARR